MTAPLDRNQLAEDLSRMAGLLDATWFEYELHDTTQHELLESLVAAMKAVTLAVAKSLQDGGVAPSDHQTRRLEEMAQRLEDARTEAEHLRHVILAAAEDIERWGAYAPGHFQKKWDLNGDIKRYRLFAWAPTLALIEEFHEPSRDDPPHCEVDGQAHPCAAVRLARRKELEG